MPWKNIFVRSYHDNLRYLLENPQLRFLLIFNNFEEPKILLSGVHALKVTYFQHSMDNNKLGLMVDTIARYISMICLWIYPAGPVRPSIDCWMLLPSLSSSCSSMPLLPLPPISTASLLLGCVWRCTQDFSPENPPHFFVFFTCGFSVELFQLGWIYLLVFWLWNNVALCLCNAKIYFHWPHPWWAWRKN